MPIFSSFPRRKPPRFFSFVSSHYKLYLMDVHITFHIFFLDIFLNIKYNGERGTYEDQGSPYMSLHRVYCTHRNPLPLSYKQWQGERVWYTWGRFLLKKWCVRKKWEENFPRRDWGGGRYTRILLLHVATFNEKPEGTSLHWVNVLSGPAPNYVLGESNSVALLIWQHFWFYMRNKGGKLSASL